MLGTCLKVDSAVGRARRKGTRREEMEVEKRTKRRKKEENNFKTWSRQRGSYEISF